MDESCATTFNREMSGLQPDNKRCKGDLAAARQVVDARVEISLRVRTHY